MWAKDRSRKLPFQPHASWTLTTPTIAREAGGRVLLFKARLNRAKEVAQTRQKHSQRETRTGTALRAAGKFGEFYELRHQPQAAVLEAEHRMAIGRWNAG